MTKNDDALAQDDENTPAKIKVGEKEYTPEEIEKLEADRAKAEEDFKNLQADYTKKSQKLSEYEKGNLINKARDIASGDDDVKNLSEGELADMKYLEKLGFIPKSQLDSIIQKAKEDTTKEVEEKLTHQQRKEKLQTEITELTKQHSFIKETELKEYMAERAKNGTILTPEEAALILYKDSFIATGKKPDELPAFDKSGKGRNEAPEPDKKILDLGSREMNDRIKEKLATKPVE